ncbi:hypothetical protein LNZ58_003694 [Escherichia coli]|nr:hypothetical protein [Escherichia coli]EKR2566481.1 hypothetical protein [Escherichia coli]
MKQSADNINDKTSRFFKQTNNISKYDSSRSKNSVPEQRTGNLSVIQQRQNNLYATYTPDVHLSAVMAEYIVVQVNIIQVKMLSDS